MFESSLSMCTVPSPTGFAINCSIQITILIAVCASLHCHHHHKRDVDVERRQHTLSVSDIFDSNDMATMEADAKLAHNVLFHTFISCLLILLALAIAIAAVICQNKWSGLLCILFLILACIAQPSILFTRSASLRHTTNTVVPQRADFTSITKNNKPRIDIDQIINMPNFRRKSTSNTLHFKSKFYDNDKRIRSISTTCTTSTAKLPKDSRFYKTKCADSLTSNKTQVSVKSSRSTQSKTSSISIQVSSGMASVPSWTQRTMSSMDTPTSDYCHASKNVYRNVKPAQFRRIVSETDMTKYIPYVS